MTVDLARFNRKRRSHLDDPPREGRPSADPVVFRRGDHVPSWLFQVAPPTCFAKFLQDTRVTPVVGADYEFVIEPADPLGGEYVLEVVSDGSPVQITAVGRGARLEGHARLTRGAASHLNRKSRRAQRKLAR